MNDYEEILNGHGMAQYGCVHCDFICGDEWSLEDHLREEHGVDL